MSSQTSNSKPKKTVIFSYLQLSNVGCEIIIRGSIRFLDRAFPDYSLKYIVSSYHQDRDRDLLGDISNVEVIPMLSWKRYFRAVLRQTKRFDKYWSPRFSTKSFKESDIFVSVGGDIYTIFDGDLPDDWMGHESFATRQGIPSIMFGANMEKFEILSKTKHDRLIDHLSRFKFLAVRDRATEKYLQGHKVKAPIVVYPDPIFSLRPSAEVRHGKVQRIGLNLSPLAVEKFGQEIVSKYATIVSDLIQSGYQFDFIPHVYSSDGDTSLDDRFILRQIFDKIEPNLQSSIRLREDALGFSKVSAAIEEVDLMIAARMHCCLNALTLGKAVYFLGYSAKAKTMLDWVVAETPYSKTQSAYATTPANDITLDAITTMIDGFERMNTDQASTPVDLEPQLGSSWIWEHAKRIEL